MSIPPPKRHGLFCRFRSMIVRRSTRFPASNIQMATSGSFPLSPGEAQYTPPAGARGPSPHFSPSYVGSDDPISLPEIPDLPSPTVAQGALPSATYNGFLHQDSPDDEPAAQNSVPTPTQQANRRSPAVTYLSLDERLGEFDIPVHDLKTDVEYDSALSTPSPLGEDRSPIAFPPANDASSPPRGRMLARKDGRMPLRPASAGANDDATNDQQEHHPFDDDDLQCNDMLSVHSGVDDSDEQSNLDNQRPETYFHVGVVRSANARLPGYELVVVAGSEAIDSIPFTAAVKKIEIVYALYRHELCHLSLEVHSATMEDGRDSLVVIMECLALQLPNFLSMSLNMPAESLRATSRDVEETMVACLSGLSHLRRLIVKGMTAGWRLLAFPRAGLRELHVTRIVSTQDVLALIREFPGLDRLCLSSVEETGQLFHSDDHLAPIPPDSAFPSLIHMTADIFVLPYILHAIPRRVRLCVTANAGAVQRAFDRSSEWSLLFPSVSAERLMSQL